MREKEYKGKPGLAISHIARMTKNITPRLLAVYINKLVDKGIFPKELKAEYEEVAEKMSPLARLQKFDKSRTAAGKNPIFTDKKTKKDKKEAVSSFKDFVNHINNK